LKVESADHLLREPAKVETFGQMAFCIKFFQVLHEAQEALIGPFGFDLSGWYTMTHRFLPPSGHFQPAREFPERQYEGF
jgi:hypothetical protein